ncbi:MAG TPA: hypothetical protein ENJ06_00180 [Phycisphaeraceae bacterium]|nr:hypothetical protein [Phycisphaeraceae bacterium]
MTSYRIRSSSEKAALTRRGSTLLIVLWTVALLGLVVVSVQTSALRQATSSRQQLSRVRARWAARAGVERIIARLAWENESPTPAGPLTLVKDLASLSEGELRGATYEIAYSDQGALITGPVDLGKKLNINTMSQAELMTLPYMTEDVADAILDWMDSDDEVRPQGAEEGFYKSGRFSYKPRNGPIRSLAELELIRGVLPEYVRGEDWNLNGRLDLNEDDGDVSWPPDNADGKLDAGWSEILTTRTTGGGPAPGGEERINLRNASVEEISNRLNIETDQAQALSYYAKNPANTLEGLLRDELNRIRPDGGVSPTPVSQVRPLSRDELRTLFDTATMQGTAFPQAGKLNINTASIEIFDYLPRVSPALADQIIFGRERLIEGYQSIVDLLDIPGVNGSILADLATILDVRSNVYRVCCRGRDEATGVVVEIIATIDRSSLPVKITEYSAE